MYTTLQEHVAGISYPEWCITKGFPGEVTFGLQQQDGSRELSKWG